MKRRTPAKKLNHGPEFKGVVKRITGKLTNRPDVEQEGRAEMSGKARRPKAARRRRLNPDPHRRG